MAEAAKEGEEEEAAKEEDVTRREGQTLFVRCEHSQTRGEFVSTHKLAASQKLLTKLGQKKAFMKS